MGKQRWVPLQDEPIKFHADYQRHWSALIEPLRREKYVEESTSSLSIHGDAPKCFLRVKEYVPGRVTSRVSAWPKYIAKVGSKWYPIESITEQLIGRVGQVFGFDVAESRLALAGRQVRFLSRYFLAKDQLLVHGLEIFREDFGEEIVTEIAETKAEREFYIFPAVIECLRKTFPEQQDAIISAFVRMLVFDAIVGNNDRHPANWGVITSVRANVPSRFSPIFDTARGLFWNNDEAFVRQRLKERKLLEKYISRSTPQIGWDGEPDLDHFALLARVLEKHPEHRSAICEAVLPLGMDSCSSMIHEEFGTLLSRERLELIQQCLDLRLRRMQELAIGYTA